MLGEETASILTLVALVALAVLCPWTPHVAWAQTRGADAIAEVSYAEDADKPFVLYHHSWAVVIGIDAYQDLPPLGGAVRDANRVAEFLKSQGFQVTTLINGQASRAAITELIGDRLPNQVGPNDRVIVYFAGHGLSRGQGDAAMGYLMPAEAKRDAPASTAISMAELQRWFAQYPAKHVLYVADACYSGLAIGTRSVGLSPQVKAYIREVTNKPVRVALVAGQNGQQASEYQGHGLFTYFLLQGWRGAADSNHDGLITTDELAAFVKPAVAQVAASEFNTMQNPQIARSGEGEFLFLSPSTRVQPIGSTEVQVVENTPALRSGTAAPSVVARSTTPTAAGQPVRAAVLYFDYNGLNADLACLQRAMAEMLLADLQGIPGVQLIERARLEQVMSELKLQQTKHVDPATATRIGQLMGAQYQIVGSFMDFQGKVRLMARVVHVGTGAIVGQEQVTGKIEDFLTLTQDLAASLRERLSQVRPPKTPAVERLIRRTAHPVQAPILVAYSAALAAKDRGDLPEARRQLQAILAQDSGFVPAQVTLVTLGP